MWESKAGSLGWWRKPEAPRQAVAGNPQPTPLSQLPRCVGTVPGTGDRRLGCGVKERKCLPSGEEPGMPSLLQHLYQSNGNSEPKEEEPRRDLVSLLTSIHQGLTHLLIKVLHLGSAVLWWLKAA